MPLPEGRERPTANGLCVQCARRRGCVLSPGKQVSDLEPLVHVIRSGLVECTHYGNIAVCDAGANVVGAVGDPSMHVYWRSSAKPIQALTVIQSGAADQFSFTAKEIAICCGSHCGSAEHAATVRSILAKIGLDESALQCGTHPPGDSAERNRLMSEGLEPSPVHNNCSGKHSGKLAGAVAMGADVATYLELDHPVQQSILGNMSALCGVPVDEISIGVDGCSAPIHGVPLQAMATAFARLCRPDEMPEAIRRAAPRIVAAMLAEPAMLSSRGGFNAVLLEATRGQVMGKGGAEGLFVIGLTDRGIGAAIRTVDGSARGQAASTIRVLELLDALDDEAAATLAPFAVDPITNCRDVKVGEVRAAEFTLR